MKCHKKRASPPSTSLRASFPDADIKERTSLFSCLGPSAKTQFKSMLQEESSLLKVFNIPKKIHLIWIGPNNISDENVTKSLDTVAKNPDYETNIYYDSGIEGYERARDYLMSKFKDSDIHLFDIRELPYFSEMKENPAFKYYEYALSENKYAQASDLLRLLILESEGGIYKDIDDVQLEPFGELAFPAGLGVNQEYAVDRSRYKDSAIPNTPIAVTRQHMAIQLALKMAVESYERGETNILKLAGPDVFTGALYNHISGLNPKDFNLKLTEWDNKKKRIFKNKNLQLSLDEIKILGEPYQRIRGLSHYVENGADHSWDK